MEGNHQGGKNDQKIHQPEFIVIGEEDKESSAGGSFQFRSGHKFETFEQIQDIKPSFPVRLACLFSSAIMFFAAFLGIFILLAFCALVLITFFQVKPLNHFARNYWKMLRKVFVLALGLMIAVVSPVFGLGIILLYFLLVAGGTSDPLFSKFFKSSLYKG